MRLGENVALTKQLAQLQIEECERQSALELEAERRRGMHTCGHK